MPEVIPTIYDKGAYDPKTKQSYKVAKSRKGKVEVVDGDNKIVTAPKDSFNYFYVLEKFGPRLKHYLSNSVKYTFNEVSIYDMAIKLLDFFEIAHNAGYVHNDIGLDTVYLSQGQVLNTKRFNKKTESCFPKSPLHVIDISYMTQYKSFQSGAHLK